MILGIICGKEKEALKWKIQVSKLSKHICMIVFLLQASSWSDFVENQKRGFECHFSADASCHSIWLICWLFILSYCAVNLTFFLMMRYTEGAIYSAFIIVLSSTLGAVFWSLFILDPDIQWSPRLIVLAFTLVGLAIMVPAGCMYNMFGIKEQTQHNNTNNGANHHTYEQSIRT